MLRGIDIPLDILFHTAAYFRDSFKGGRHWETLYKVNVKGTENLLAAAYEAGIPRVVHTSSVGVLTAPAGVLIDETMDRPETGADDYFRSKILADRKVYDFLAGHPDMESVMVLPGWMVGPGDIGPTSSGQMVLDFVNRKLPGIVPATFSVVDARDVAVCQIAAAERGRTGERYIAAGRAMTMAGLFSLLEKVTGVPAPSRRIPMWLLFGLAACNRRTGLNRPRNGPPDCSRSRSDTIQPSNWRGGIGTKGDQSTRLG